MEHTLSLLRQGNHGVFKELFDMYFDPLCRYAFSILKDADESQDIVQKVFFKLWDGHQQIEIQTSIKSYLYRIVHNESINFLNQRANRMRLNNQILDYRSFETNNTSEHVISTDLQKAIDQALAELPTQCRKVFEMSRMNQMTYLQIANDLSISVNTVENHISKALKKLRVSLNDYLVVHISLILFNQH